MEEFKNFLNELSRILGIGSLTPDEYGVCLLAFDKHNLEVLFEVDSEILPNTVLMTCRLGEIDQKQKISVIKEILQANSEIEEILSYQKEGNSLFIHRRLSMDIADEYMKSTVDNFIKQALKWRKKTTFQEE